MGRTWGERAGLEVRCGRLRIAGRDAEPIARERWTTPFVRAMPERADA